MIEIREWVTPIVVGAYPHETVKAVVDRMYQHRIGSVIVHDKGQQPMGILTERDVLNKIVAAGRDPNKTLVKEVMTSPIETVNINRPAFDIFKLFAERDFRHLPITLDDGRVVGVLSLRSKTFLQEICRLMEVLKNVNELKSHFLANVSHELKTPLASITGSATLIMENFKDMGQEEIFKFLQIIERQGHHLQRVITDLLDVTALEAGKMRIERSYVDLMRVVDTAIKSAEILANRKRIKLSFENHTKQTTIFADENRILQVLINLIMNAIKFTPEGGQIIIAIHSEDSHKHSLRVAVKDTGVGIPKEKLRMIFERFERAHDTALGNKHDGIGLGLTIVKEIVTLHQGKVWVESEERKGSTFYFTIPANQETLTDTGEPAPVKT